MPTSLWCSIGALLIAVQALAVGALPAAPAFPMGVVFQVLCTASVTLLAWIATDGRRPTLVVAGAMILAFLAARGQPELLAGAAAAALTGGILLFKTRGQECVESSQP